MAQMRALPSILLCLTFATTAVAQDAGVPARQTIVHDGIERGYYVVEPPAVAAGSALVPLVLVLHGGGGNGINAIEMTGFDRKAGEEGFIAVFPEGTGRTVLLTWNAEHCCAYAMTEEIDDVAFIAALIDELVRAYPVDPARIYVTGMSNGAMMSHRLGAALPDRIAAIAPVVGAVFGDEQIPAGPVPAIIINGADDLQVPFAGGPPPRNSGPLFGGAWDGVPLLPSPAQAAFWSAANDCAHDEPVPEETDAYTLWRYTCPEGAEVEFYLVRDNGHAWPGGTAPARPAADVPTQAFDATDVIWEFFARHALAAPG